MKLYRFALALAAVLPCLATLAAERQTRPVRDFENLEVSAPVKLDLRLGEAENLEVEGDPLELRDLETFVTKGTLVIRTKPGYKAVWKSPVRVFVTARSIEGLMMTGSGEISSPQLRTEKLAIRSTGSGAVRIPTLSSSYVQVLVSGSGEVALGGVTNSVDASVTGSGNLKAEKLEARRAKVFLSGSGDASIFPREQLDAAITGSGSVRYRGDPAVKKTISGSGSLRRLGA